ncbi:MAG: DUF262 domain-containing protein [Endomicrobiaceae bacterium]|nr:DUF262 domain-containing protein [Endomicrobiaceae bacterium]
MNEFNKPNFTNLITVLAGNYFYQVPKYQRSYSWNKDNCDTLLGDLIEAYENNKEQSYFCGSLVLLENKNDKRFDVIDGQQRLTTFTILLVVLRDYYNDKLNDISKAKIKNAIYGIYGEGERIKFLTDLSKQTAFQNVLQKVDFNKVEESKQNRYLQNAYFIKNYLIENEKFMSYEINDFINYLYKFVDFVVITVNDLDNGIKIFNVLNDRGLPLKPADILKSSMMSKLNEENQKIFASSWDNIYKKLDSNDDTLDKVLNHYAFYTIAENPSQRYDKILLDKFNKENTTMLNKVGEIEKFIDAYNEVVDKQDKNIYLLRYIRWQYWLPILITAYYINYRNFNELTSILVAYFYQNWIAGYTLTRIKQTSFNIMKAIKENKSIEEIKNICKTNLDKYSTTKNFKSNLSMDIDEEVWIKPILLLLEYYRQDDSKVNFIELTSKLHLEHILPQKIKGIDKNGKEWNREWIKDFNLEEHQQFVHKLGNLTLLSMKKNEEAKNFSFNTKKDVYRNKNNQITSFIITQDVSEYQTWIGNDITTRHTKLMDAICKEIDVFK